LNANAPGFSQRCTQGQRLPWSTGARSQTASTPHNRPSSIGPPIDDLVYSSSAQMFDERGEGISLRGGARRESQEARRPQPSLPTERRTSLLYFGTRSFVYRQENWAFRAGLYEQTPIFVTDEREGIAQSAQRARHRLCRFILWSKSYAPLSYGRPPNIARNSMAAR